MVDKVAVVCPNIGIVYSGMGPDFRVLIARARKSAQAYWKIYGEYPPTRVLTQELATIMQKATQSGYVISLRPTTGAHDRSKGCTPVWRIIASRGVGHNPRPQSVSG